MFRFTVLPLVISSLGDKSPCCHRILSCFLLLLPSHVIFLLWISSLSLVLFFLRCCCVIYPFPSSAPVSLPSLFLTVTFQFGQVPLYWVAYVFTFFAFFVIAPFASAPLCITVPLATARFLTHVFIHGSLRVHISVLFMCLVVLFFLPSRILKPHPRSCAQSSPSPVYSTVNCCTPKQREKKRK